MLDSIVKSQFQSSQRAFVGILVGFKTLPNNKEAMIIRQLKGIDKNGVNIEGDVYTVTQGEIDNKEIAAKRNTVETFKNPISKHYLEAGAIVSFERCKISNENKTVEASFIKDLVKVSKTEERTILMGLAKPLPVSSNSSSGTASVEFLMPEFKREVSTLQELDKAMGAARLVSSEKMKQCGITGKARAAIIITDAENSKPFSVIVNSVGEQVGSDMVYRDPTGKEFGEQVMKNSILCKIRQEIFNNPNKIKLFVSPGLRLMVPASKAAENGYAKSTIREYTGTFKIKGTDEKTFESLGYKTSVLSLWGGAINSICPLEYCTPLLTDDASSAGIKTQRSVKASLAESKNKSIEASDQAASALEQMAARMSMQNNSSDIEQMQESAEYSNPERHKSDDYMDDEDEFDIGLLSAPLNASLQHSDEPENISGDDIEEYFASNMTTMSSH